MSAEALKPIGIKIGELVTFFTFKPVSLATMRAFSLRRGAFGDLSEPEKTDEEVKVDIDALASWITAVPTKKQPNLETGNVEHVPIYDHDLSPEVALRKYFEELPVEMREWVSNALIGAYQEQLTPKVVF